MPAPEHRWPRVPGTADGMPLHVLVPCWHRIYLRCGLDFQRVYHAPCDRSLLSARRPFSLPLRLRRLLQAPARESEFRLRRQKQLVRGLGPRLLHSRGSALVGRRQRIEKIFARSGQGREEQKISHRLGNSRLC